MMKGGEELPGDCKGLGLKSEAEGAQILETKPLPRTFSA